MKYLVLALALAALSGCVNIEGDKTGTKVVVDNNSSYTTTDVSVICQNNTDTQCYTPGYSGYVDSNGDYNDVADVITGDYDASYTPSECAANGYFWCSIEQRCLNIQADSGTCNR